MGRTQPFEGCYSGSSPDHRAKLYIEICGELKEEKMTKNEEKLVWRLKERPTAESVASLVSSDVITKEEARDILFSENTAISEEEVKALKEQIKFLQGLLEKALEKNRNTWVNVPYTFTYSTPNRYWKDQNTWLSSSFSDGHMSVSPGRIEIIG